MIINNLKVELIRISLYLIMCDYSWKVIMIGGPEFGVSVRFAETCVRFHDLRFISGLDEDYTFGTVSIAWETITVSALPLTLSLAVCL